VGHPGGGAIHGGYNEGRCIDIEPSTQQTLVGGANKEADKEKTDNVKSEQVSKIISNLRADTDKVIRQKTCLIAPGRALMGFSASADARPTSSVPEKAKAAVTKTVHTPLKPFRNAPGSYHNLAPQYSL